MKKCIFIIVLFFNLDVTSAQDGNRPFVFQFNKIEYYSPANIHFPSKSEIIENNSIITVDLDLESIEIISLYHPAPAKSTYRIKEIYERETFIRFICEANNYAEIIIDLDSSLNWVKRTVIHNGIYHKFYNY